MSLCVWSESWPVKRHCSFVRLFYTQCSIAPTRQESLCPVMLRTSWMLVEVCSCPVLMSQTRTLIDEQRNRKDYCSQQLQWQVTAGSKSPAGTLFRWVSVWTPVAVLGPGRLWIPETCTVDTVVWCRVTGAFFFHNGHCTGGCCCFCFVFWGWGRLLCCSISTPQSVCRLITSEVNDQQKAINKAEMWLMKCSCLSRGEKTFPTSSAASSVFRGETTEHRLQPLWPWEYGIRGCCCS